MRRAVYVLLTVVILCVTSATAVLAGGDMNCERHRGDKGQGEVLQHQVQVRP